MAAIALLTAPGRPCWTPRRPARRITRVDVPLRQHIEELYATRCAACRRPVVAEQFVWPRDGDAPGRKIYRCEACDLSRGGPEERSAPVDEVDLAKLGIERASGEAVPPGDEPEATVGSASDELGPPSGAIDGADELEMSIGESGGHHHGAAPAIRRARYTARVSLDVRPEPIPSPRRGARVPRHYVAARAVPSSHRENGDECSTCTAAQLYALHAIAPRSTRAA